MCHGRGRDPENETSAERSQIALPSRNKTDEEYTPPGGGVLLRGNRQPHFVAVNNMNYHFLSHLSERFRLAVPKTSWSDFFAILYFGGTGPIRTIYIVAAVARTISVRKLLILATLLWELNEIKTESCNTLLPLHIRPVIWAVVIRLLFGNTSRIESTFPRILPVPLTAGLYCTGSAQHHALWQTNPPPEER